MTISSTTPLIGFSNDQESGSGKFALGTVVIANATDYVYIQAAANVAVSQVFGIDQPAFASNAATTGYTHDVPANYSGNVSVLSGHYFWAKKTSSPF